MSSKIRLGTASPSPQPTTSATLSHISQLAHRASSSSIDILLLPEAYIGGYPRGTSFGCVIGSRSDEGREEYAKYFDSAVDLGDVVGEGAGGGRSWVKRELGGDEDDEEIDESGKRGRKVRGDGTREELERIARKTDVFIVVGCIEKAGGSLYCSVVYVEPARGMLGKRRKVMPTGSERLVWAQGSPATLRAVTTHIRGTRINLAAAICWENYMPLLRQALYQQNINLYLAPTADNRDAWMGLMRTVGVEGRCFVVSSNMCQRGEASVHGTGTSNVSAVQGNGSRVSRNGESGLGGGRRNSVFTEEGHEICLPSHGSANGSSSTTQQQKKKRRKSVIDEDGNEIVLCCDEDGENCEPVNGTGSTAKETTTNGTTFSTFISRGGSSIVDPYGNVLAGPQWEDEDNLIWSDVDFRECIKGRLDLDAGGSYSRNDSFKFSVTGLDLEPLPY